jgi:hypothetical protein
MHPTGFTLLRSARQRVMRHRWAAPVRSIARLSVQAMAAEAVLNISELNSTLKPRKKTYRMDYETYRQQFFANPLPLPRFAFVGLHGLTLYFAEYEAAVAYYQRVLGPPAYVEGQGTHGWQIGDTWLTLLKGNGGNPQNVEVMIVMKTPAEAERLQAALVEAGGAGDPPSDQLMYAPVRSCPVRDPFGTNILIICPLPRQAG